MWSRTRALWVFSTLAARRPCPEFRELADTLYDFCIRVGRNPRGRWVFRVSRQGEMLQDAHSIYTDGFAMMGLSAYFRLTQIGACRQVLQETCESVITRLASPGSCRTFPYTLPSGTKVHGVAMLFSLAFWEAGLALGDARLCEHSLSLAQDFLDHFVLDKEQAVVEFLDLESRRLPGAIGQCCLPVVDLYSAFPGHGPQLPGPPDDGDLLQCDLP